MRNMTGRAKNKSIINPKHKCFICGNKIFNKMKDAKYCKSCGIFVADLSKKINSTLHNLSKKFPDYKCSFSIKSRKVSIKKIGGKIDR